MILPAFRRNRDRRNIYALYGMIVAQARQPLFYSGYGVADTVQGRFELIVLHLVLVLARLDGGESVAAAPPPGRAARWSRSGRTIGQDLFDMFCRDLDHNLREMGVGDLAVPREMRHFGEAYYGRQGAYRAGLAAADQQELEKALARNIFEAADVDDRAARLARYVRAAARQLDTEAEDELIAGKAVFPDPEAFAHA
jgi:cytochrome b pre-mRNA-processing protein 3